MKQELQEVKALLQRLTAPASAGTGAGPTVGAEVSLRGAQFKGDSKAPVMVVEFSDFQCPFCARYAATTYVDIVRDYVDTGRVRYAFMNFPIDSLHPVAFAQHMAAACATDQGRFWEMHDRLFANPRVADADGLLQNAAAVGLDIGTFRACLASERHADEIRQAMRVGSAIGVNGTPTFLIGTVGPYDKFKVARLIAGAKPFSAFKEAIDSVSSAAAASDVPVPPVSAVALPGGWKAAE